MAEKLIIVMANTDLRNGEELGAPIFQATVGAAMEIMMDDGLVLGVEEYWGRLSSARKSIGISR